jgi:hypothetical protein
MDIMITIKEIECLSTERIDDLNKLARGLDYSGINRMLEDNPGMIEAIYNFVLDNWEKYYKHVVTDYDTEDFSVENNNES